MLYRKISKDIEAYLRSDSDKFMLYMPIYYIMFVDAGGEDDEDVNF